MGNKDVLIAVKEAAKDEVFMNELAKAESEDAFAEKLATKGIEVSQEEAAYLYKVVLSAQNDEIGEDDLENVAGGFCVEALVGVAACAAFLYGFYRSMRCKKR